MASMVTYLDPVSGGFIEVDNRLLITNAAVNKVNRLLCQKIGDDIQYPTQGNPLVGVKDFLTSNDIISGIATCLAPLMTTGEISTYNIINLQLTPIKRWLINLQIVLPNGDSEPLQWSQ